MSHQATPPQGEIYRDSISLIDKGVIAIGFIPRNLKDHYTRVAHGLALP